MTTHKVLIIPADVEQPIVLYDLEEDQEIEKLIYEEGTGGHIDIGAFRHHGLQYAVGEFSLLDGSPINTRAISIIRRVTEHPSAVRFGVAGTCVLMGCTYHGDYADVPDTALIAAGVK